MNDAERDEFSRYWQDKYGEPIECEVLRRVASLPAVLAARIDFDDLRAMPGFAALLERQRLEIEQFLDAPQAGTQRSLRAGLHELEAAKLAGRADDGITPSHALVAHAADALISDQRRIENDLRRDVVEFPAWCWNVGKKAADVAFGLACSAVDYWIRDRHRNAQGERDGNGSWPNVAKLLEWYGHDLTDKAHKDKSCQQAALRVRNRIAADKRRRGGSGPKGEGG